MVLFRFLFGFRGILSLFLTLSSAISPPSSHPHRPSCSLFSTPVLFLVHSPASYCITVSPSLLIHLTRFGLQIPSSPGFLCSVLFLLSRDRPSVFSSCFFLACPPRLVVSSFSFSFFLFFRYLIHLFSSRYYVLILCFTCFLLSAALSSIVTLPLYRACISQLLILILLLSPLPLFYKHALLFARHQLFF